MMTAVFFIIISENSSEHLTAISESMLHSKEKDSSRFSVLKKPDIFNLLLCDELISAVSPAG